MLRHLFQNLENPPLMCPFIPLSNKQTNKPTHTYIQNRRITKNINKTPEAIPQQQTNRDELLKHEHLKQQNF